MYWICIFLLLFVVELLYFRLAAHFNIVDKPNQRSSHTQIILRGGGIVFYSGMVCYAAFFGLEYLWFLIGLTLIAGISFMDDIHPVKNRIRLLFHFIAMLLLFYQWGLFTDFPLWYIVPALIFCMGIINAYNFMDGINGITGGYSLVVLGALAYINLTVIPFINPELIYVALLSVLAFNFFNFRKRAKCFAGDVGSVSIAFIILFALGQLILVSGDFSYIILLAVYGVDSILTIIHRLLLHENIFEPHRKHLYQLMANELKVPHVTVSLLYMLVQAAIVIGFIACKGFSLVYLLSVIGVLCVFYIGFVSRYFHLHAR